MRRDFPHPIQISNLKIHPRRQIWNIKLTSLVDFPPFYSTTFSFVTFSLLSIAISSLNSLLNIKIEVTRTDALGTNFSCATNVAFPAGGAVAPDPWMEKWLTREQHWISPRNSLGQRCWKQECRRLPWPLPLAHLSTIQETKDLSTLSS